MPSSTLETTAQALLAPGKGIRAADESHSVETFRDRYRQYVALPTASMPEAIRQT